MLYSAMTAIRMNTFSFFSVIHCLMAEGPMSKSKIISVLNITPSSLTLLLNTLQDELGAVECTDGRWRATYAIEDLAIDSLSARLPDVTFLEETTSTNEQAMKRPSPNFVFTEYQKLGRGRHKQRWLSLPGGSVLFSARLSASMKSLLGLPLAICVALWRALGKDILAIKWPNDLMDKQGRKIAGILVSDKGNDIVIGVGINWHINDKLRTAIGKPVGALSTLKQAPSSRAAVAEIAATALLHGVEEFRHHGLASFLEDAKQAHYVPAGKQLLFEDSTSRRSAVFCGFGDGGELLLRDQYGERKYTSGEIRNVACS